MKLPDWEKFKILFTPYFIIFYIFCIVIWLNRAAVGNFLKSIFYGKYGYSGSSLDYIIN